MNSKIKKLLEKIESNGFEAYVVGGFVRDNILGINTTDVDICTNALPKDIIKIFNVSGNHINYGSISVSDDKYNFDITTYRKESNYDKRVPLEIEYVNNLITDLKRRDFTINTLCMNSNGQIIDILNGKEDLEKRVIKVVGDSNQKLSEDPLRILRAIRFSIILDFDLDEEIIKFIHLNKSLIKTLSYTRRQEELNRIFASKNVAQGLKVLKELDLLEVLEIDYNEIKIVPDILGIWAQIKWSEKYSFTKSSLETINAIRKIILVGEINNKILFDYELYISMVAGEILGYKQQDITKRYSMLPINSVKDLKINSGEIFDILNIKPSPKVKLILNDLISAVLDNKLDNNYDSLKEYLLNKWM